MARAVYETVARESYTRGVHATCLRVPALDRVREVARDLEHVVAEKRVERAELVRAQVPEGPPGVLGELHRPPRDVVRLPEGNTGLLAREENG